MGHYEAKFELHPRSRLDILSGLWQTELVLACSADVYKAASAGDVAALTAMLEEDPLLARAELKEGSTALHVAAERGNLDLVKLILPLFGAIGPSQAPSRATR